MNKVPDRAKMRREYVRKKTMALAVQAVGTSIGVVFGVLLFRIATKSPHLSDADFNRLLAFIGALLIGGGLCFISEKQRLALPHVPSAREQLPTLTAEEVLLRGSQASTASPEELLRPAGKQETLEGELLRASIAENGWV